MGMFVFKRYKEETLYSNDMGGVCVCVCVLGPPMGLKTNRMS